MDDFVRNHKSFTIESVQNFSFQFLFLSNLLVKKEKEVGQKTGLYFGLKKSGESSVILRI